MGFVEKILLKVDLINLKTLFHKGTRRRHKASQSFLCQSKEFFIFFVNLCVSFEQLRDIFWGDGKKAKYFPLAPIEVEILVARGSGCKIETDSGTNVC
ncbi:MAG TPA: hypothetical protein VJU52_15445 [Flavobacterium sp.]|nr:hypothetical protein [Flavobacterium sp.]